MPRSFKLVNGRSRSRLICGYYPPCHMAGLHLNLIICVRINQCSYRARGKRGGGPANVPQAQSPSYRCNCPRVRDHHRTAWKFLMVSKQPSYAQPNVQPPPWILPVMPPSIKAFPDHLSDGSFPSHALHLPGFIFSMEFITILMLFSLECKLRDSQQICLGN